MPAERFCSFVVKIKLKMDFVFQEKEQKQNKQKQRNKRKNKKKKKKNEKEKGLRLARLFKITFDCTFSPWYIHIVYGTNCIV